MEKTLIFNKQLIHRMCMRWQGIEYEYESRLTEVHNYGGPFVSKLFLALDYQLFYKLVLLFRLGNSNLMFFGKLCRQYS